MSFKLRRYIIQNNKIYLLKLACYLVKIASHIKMIGEFCPNNWYILAKLDLFAKATTRRIVSSRFETLP